MIAMILAAGKGERMRPLTDSIPKPLLEINSKPLIVYQIEALRDAGISKIVINLGYLGEQISDYLKDGEEFGVEINYSIEGDPPLETAGGIVNALDLLGSESFVITNSDIFTDFDYRALPNRLDQVDAHLVLVSNPKHHTQGDFVLEGDRVANEGENKLTYSGIAVFHPRFFKDCDPGRFPLAPLLQKSADKNRLSGQIFTGTWHDIGTPERLLTVQNTVLAD